MNQFVEMEESITVRVPRGTSLALERAAIGSRARPGQLARRILLDGSRASGFEFDPVASLPMDAMTGVGSGIPRFQ